MKRSLLFVLLLALLVGNRAAAARIDTLSLRSAALGREVTVVAVLPDAASECRPAPLLLLLHGYGGDAFSWLKIRTGLPELVDRLPYGVHDRKREDRQHHLQLHLCLRRK